MDQPTHMSKEIEMKKCLMCGIEFSPKADENGFVDVACKKCLRSCRKKDGRPDKGWTYRLTLKNSLS